MSGPSVVPENYNARYDRGAQGARGIGPPPARRGADSALQRMEDEVPGLQVELDDTTGLPSRIATTEPAAELAPAEPTPEDAIRKLIGTRGALWALDEEDADTVQVVSVSRRGLRTVRLVQQVDGVEVFGSGVTVAVTPDNAVTSVAGQLFPGAASAAPRAKGALEASTEEAIARAASDLTRVGYEAADFALSAAPADGAYRWYDYRQREGDRRPGFERPVRAKDVLYPLGDGEFAPGCYAELWVRGFPAFSYVIAADPPFVLFRKNLSSHVAFSYRVHNTGDDILRPHDGPAPGSPHPAGVPDGFQAAPIPEQLVAVESLLPGDPWLPDDATQTRGNNCIAYADLRDPQGESAGDVTGAVTSPRAFDYTYDHARAANDPTNLQNSLVGMFFHVNWLHDRWYEAGFDEAAGNAQLDNFGRGGLGGDPILAEGNDFSGTDNANMSTPADGSSPRMQMFEFLGPSPGNPSRTSNHEALITFHEMGHYITNRLVGNGTGLENRQGGALGEGWGDFFAVCMTSQVGDDFLIGAFPVGGWTDLQPTFDDNYYFSIRRYPYSADMDKNPLTFRHISNGVALPSGPPVHPGASGANSAVHNAGEIWCTALWDALVNLIERHGHTEGERRMLLYVVGGLEITPSRPTFVQARDAIVSAVSAMDPTDLRPVWHGFAKRGLGDGAVAPPSGSTGFSGVVESFEVPDGLPEA